METRKVHVTWTNENRTGDEMIDPALAEVETGTQAYPTSRLLDGSSDHGYAEEWAEPATLPDGRPCLRMYLFDDEDIHDEEGEPLLAENYPWDHEHVRRILLLDE
jgi:hypothetical protein